VAGEDITLPPTESADVRPDSGDAQPTPADSKPRRKRRWIWIVLVVDIALLVGLRALLPTIVERGAAYGSRYWLGLPARIDNVDFDLVDGVVVLEGVSVGREPDNVLPEDAAFEPPAIDRSTALLHFDRISARLSWKDLRDHALRLVDLTLEAPLVRVEREADGAIDPLRHARPLAPASPAEPETGEPSRPWPVSVDRFALRAPNVVIVDPPTGGNLLEFSLESFGLDHVAVNGSSFALGGIDVEGPVLRVRRDLVLSGSSAKPGTTAAPSPPAAGAPAAPAPASSPAAAPASPPVAAPASPPAATPPPAPAATPQPAASAAAPPATSAPSRAGYRIEKIDIARATFTWVTDHGPLDVALALKASDITADEGKTFPVDLKLDINKGHVSVAGDVGILPPTYKGKLAWNGLPFPPLLLASLPDLAAWLRSADSTAALEIDADIAGSHGPPSIRMAGHATVATLAIADPGDKEVAVGFKELEVAMKDVLVPLPEAGKPMRTTVVQLDLVKLTQPTIRYTHPSPSLYALLGIAPPQPATAAPQPATVAAAKDGKAAATKDQSSATKQTSVAAPAAKVATAPPAKAVASKPVAASAKAAAAKPAAPTTIATDAPPPPSSPVDVSIASLELVAGDLAVTDTTVAPPVVSTVKDLFVTARDVHIPDPSAHDISIRAILPKVSELTIKGDLKPGNVGDFTVSLQKLDLPVFSPYAMMGGASLDAGQATVKTSVKLRGKMTQIDSELVLRKLGVSLRDPSTFDRSFGMSIDLVLALLRDPAGDIRLRIPVKMDEKGTEVDTGAIIASAVRDAILGALTSPLKLLGGAFGAGGGSHDAGNAAGGAVGIAPLRFDAGSAEPAADAASRVDGLAKLLADRPVVKLVLRGRTSPEDRPFVAEQLLIERIKAGKGLPDVEGSGFLARRRISQALVAADKSGAARKGPPAGMSPEDKARYDKTIAAVEIPNDRLVALASARAASIRALLVAKKIDPSRVAVGEREADGEAGVVVSLAAR